MAISDYSGKGTWPGAEDNSSRDLAFWMSKAEYWRNEYLRLMEEHPTNLVKVFALAFLPGICAGFAICYWLAQSGLLQIVSITP